MVHEPHEPHERLLHAQKVFRIQGASFQPNGRVREFIGVGDLTHLHRGDPRSGECEWRDNPELWPYAQAMAREEPIIRLTLDVTQPVELGDYVAAFTSLAAEYDRYIRWKEPRRNPEATLLVKQVREGSLVALLIPLLTADGMIAAMSAYNTADEFVERLGARIRSYSQNGGRVADATKSELKDWSEQVAAIANNPNSRLEVAAIHYEKGEEKVTAAFQFSTIEAREIQHRIEEHKLELDHRSRADHERVLMVFTRSDVRTTPIGKRSGEQVVIEDISDRPRPLVYASGLAEEQIKHEITEAEDNVYKKGFVVDVNVETRGGKPIAYAVTALHQVIDLPDD